MNVIGLIIAIGFSLETFFATSWCSGGQMFLLWIGIDFTYEAPSQLAFIGPISLVHAHIKWSIRSTFLCCNLYCFTACEITLDSFSPPKMFILFDWSPPFATEVGTFESFMSFVQKDTAVVSFCHNSGLSYDLLWMFKMFDWSVCFWSTCGGWRLSPGSVGFEHCLKMTHLWDLRRRGGTPVPLKRWKAQSTRLAKPPVIAQPGITRHCLPLLILPSSPLCLSPSPLNYWSAMNPFCPP